MPNNYKYQLRLNFVQEEHADIFCHKMDEIGRTYSKDFSGIVWTEGIGLARCANDLITAGFLSQGLVTVDVINYNEKDML